uniref:PA domain-containing protein n=1 Tax=Branchiostoma floridae TaxID=7739 RepID=C3ZCX2_BRAFL|eukprot:XP_002593614.1 hypothetical protein BRAFLDRAFT_98736 [Branchiostoma floridae]
MTWHDSWGLISPHSHLLLISKINTILRECLSAEPVEEGGSDHDICATAVSTASGPPVDDDDGPPVDVTPTENQGIQVQPDMKSRAVQARLRVGTCKGVQIKPTVTTIGIQNKPSVKTISTQTQITYNNRLQELDAMSEVSEPVEDAAYENDPDYEPMEISDDEEDPPEEVPIPEATSDTLPDTRIFMVFWTCLVQLFSTWCCCPACPSRKLIWRCKEVGTHLLVTFLCRDCSYEDTWRSQPSYGRTAAGNILLSSAILFAGASVTKVLRVLSHMGVAVMSTRSFFRHQENILFRAIRTLWRERQFWMLTVLQAEQEPIVCAVAAVPTPGYYWDLSGKCNPQGSSQKQCNKSCRSKMVYANTGNRTGVASGSLYLVANGRGGASSTSNLQPCAIKTDRKRKDFIDFGSFRGSCPAQPELCRDGLTLAVWMKMQRKDNTYGDGQNPDLYFISTGGQTRSSRGFSVSAEWISMPSVAYRFALCTTIRDFDGVWFQCTHDVPDGTWFHFVFTWNKQTMLKDWLNSLAVSQMMRAHVPAQPCFCTCLRRRKQTMRLTVDRFQVCLVLMAILPVIDANNNGTVLLKGEVGPVHCGNETAQHFTRVGRVINLIYNVTVGGEEQLFAFPSGQLNNLTANDTLKDAVEGFDESYPAASAEAMPSLVQDYYDLLDSFNCSTSGPNCNLTRGEEAVVPLVPYDVLLSYPPLGREGPNNTAVTVDGADPAREYEDTRTLHIEPEYQDDPDAVQFFNAYSPAGHPVGELVFANYGRLEDFDYLRQVGVNCTGKIVLMKYRSGGRGQKAKNAASAGAIGAILYPEPADTNEPGGKVYPDGWNLPGTGTERGGALLETGDPLTAGYPATDYAYRLSKDKSNVFPPIPLQPIAYNDAQKYLSHLDGDIAPAGWNGSLPITYRLGPGFTGDCPLQIRSLNDQMVQVNTAFIDIHQPHHSNKHVLYSPSGCATNRSAAFPGIVRTMCGGPADDEGWEEVKKEVAAIASTIQSAADVISDVDSILGPF